jgi:hypothetical protein
MDKTRVYSFDGDPVVIINTEEDHALAVVLMREGNICTAATLITPFATLEPYKCPMSDQKIIHCKGGFCGYPVPEDAGFAHLSDMCERCWIESAEAELKELEEMM